LAASLTARNLVPTAVNLPAKSKSVPNFSIIALYQANFLVALLSATPAAIQATALA